MIIDVHIHANPSATGQTLSLLREEFRRNGVSLGLLNSLGVKTWSKYPISREVREANKEAQSLAESSRGMLRWLAYINPQNNNWRKEIDCCLAGGTVGIKLWCSLKDKQGRLKNTENVLDYAGKQNLPALIHTYNRTADPNLPGEITLVEFMWLAKRHPQTRMIAAHVGHNWPAETGIYRHIPKNVWIDICGGYPVKGQLEVLVREMGADRILFASDWPCRSLPSQLAKVIFADISETQKKKIFSQNAISLFGFHDGINAGSEAPRGKPRGNLLRRSSLGYAGRVFAEPCEARSEASERATNTILSSIAASATEDFPCGSRLRRISSGYGDREPQGFPWSSSGRLAKKGQTAELSPYPVDATEDHFCFCGRWPFFKTDCPTPKTLEIVLAKAGIKRAYTADLGSVYRQDLASTNDDFMAACRGLKRVKPLAVMNPRVPDWKHVLDNISGKFAGIILFPHLYNWNLADQKYFPLFRHCRQNGIKIWINCRLGDDRFRHAGTTSRPVSGEELLSLADSVEMPPVVFQGVLEGALDAFLKRHGNDIRFKFEISHLTDSPGALRRILKKHGNKRLVMGSEYPFRDIRQVRWTSRRV